MKIEILQPSGYCSGVSNAISKALQIKEENPEKSVYILGGLVHNSHVIKMLKNAGLLNLDDGDLSLEKKIQSLPNDSIVVFSAHGHDEKLDKIAKEKNMTYFDCVCPKVQASMNQIKQKINEGYAVIYIGIHNHPETIASMSISSKIQFYDAKHDFFSKIATDKPVFVTNQTTLNFKELGTIFEKIKKIYPNAIFNDEICPATRIRQENILNISDDADCVFVVGDKSSSNTKRLYEISKKFNKKASTYLISSESDLSIEMLVNKQHIVITSGTSTPREVIDSVYSRIEELSK